MFLSPYHFAYQLDKHYRDTDQKILEADDYHNVVQTFEAIGCEKNKKACLDLFKRLPKEEVIRRANIVVRLSKLLSTIKYNHTRTITSPNVIQSTQNA